MITFMTVRELFELVNEGSNLEIDGMEYVSTARLDQNKQKQ